MKKILLLSHEMTYTGAPRSLLQMAKILQEARYSVSVWTLQGGEFEKEFSKLGIEVMLMDFPEKVSDKLAEELKEFQLVFANTIFTAFFAQYAQRYTKTVLYIREAHNIPQLIEACNLHESDILSISNVVCVSEYAKEFIGKRYRRDDIFVIHNYVDDIFTGKKRKVRLLKRQIDFMVLGTVEPRKGQDIAINAFRQLLEEKGRIGYLHLVGAMPKWAADYQKDLKIESEERIIYHGEIHSRKKLMKLYEKVDVVLIPSIDESCSLVTLEAAMMEKAIILTENVGAKYLVESSCIVPVRNSKRMKEKMYEYVCEPEKIAKDGKENRKRYLESATKKYYRKALFDYIKTIKTKSEGIAEGEEEFVMGAKENKYAVSIIVPTYNVEKFLEECMDSIIGQSLKDIEIICVDDGSTDNSGSILDKYAKRDSRVKVYHNSNGGYGKAMNFGLSKATGEFIGIVEPDDYITVDMFEKLYIEAKKNHVTLVKANFKRFYGEKGKHIFEEVLFSENKNYYNKIISPKEDPTVLFGTMNIWTGIYNRQFIENEKIRFNETPGASFQDNGFWFQTMTLAERVYFLDEFFYMNRRDNPNSSVKGTEKAFCVLEEFAFIEDFLNCHCDIKQIFVEYFVKCKLIGYIAAYNRSSTRHKMVFILSASEDLRKHFDAGEIRKSLYGPNQWKKLNMVISDPVQFFLDDINGSGYDKRLIETYEKIAIANNKLRLLEEMGVDTICKINDINMKALKVSIVIPAYNAEQYIDECIESILAQTLKDIEVICVDDGSDDETFNKLLEWKRKDNRIRIVCQTNKGSGYARNQAMKTAKGKYIMFMDADDWYPSHTVIETLYTVAEEQNMVIVGGEIRAYRNGAMCDILDYYTFSKEGVISFADYQLDYGYTRFIYNLEFLRERNIEFPNYIRFQDPVFFVRALSAAEYFYALKFISYAYRKTDKRKRFNAKQCGDILAALGEELILAKEGDFVVLQDRIKERIITEYFDNFAFYFCSNEVTVVGAFAYLFKLLDVETKVRLLKKISYYTSTHYVIPYKKQNQKMEKIEELNEKLRITYSQLENADRERKQARFEVNSIRSSFSYKLGMFFTFFPRKIRGMIKNRGE